MNIAHLLRRSAQLYPDQPAVLHGDQLLFTYQALGARTAALAAWVHILAFDLMVGLYIRHEGAIAGISHWALLPCYVLTLMFGPLGLLAFLALRWGLAVAV